MGIEIERKFLVTQPAVIGYAVRVDRIRQGYLNTDIDRTVRVRVVENKSSAIPYGTAYMTIKGRNNGATRPEYEYEIPTEDGWDLLGLCEVGYVDKFRHVVPSHGFNVEVDVFCGNNEGLIVAEIEFDVDDSRADWDEQKIRPILPVWLGEEVTDDMRYYNSSLLKNPFKYWST